MKSPQCVLHNTISRLTLKIARDWYFTVNCAWIFKSRKSWKQASHPPCAAFRHTWRESVHNLTDHFIAHNAVSGCTLFTALIWANRAPVLCFLVPGAQRLQRREKLVSRGQDGLQTGKPHCRRQRSVVREPGDQLINSLGRGSDQLSAVGQVGDFS